MEYITNSDINKFGSYSDRKNHFDDDQDVTIMINFLTKMYKNQNVSFIEKPFGIYDVDLGVYIDGTLTVTVDVERWSAWTNDWPSYYKHVSFLGRKEKFLQRPTNFLMSYFNFDRTKVLCVDKKSIMKYPTIERHTKGKLEGIKQVGFHEARLYGQGLTDREKTLFKYYCCELK